MKLKVVGLFFMMTLGAWAYQLLLLDDAPPDHGMPDDYSNLDSVENILDEMGISYDHWHNNGFYKKTADVEFLQGYDIILWYNDNRAIDQAEFDALRQWVSEGGFLTVTGEDSLGSPNDPLLAALVGSTTFGDFPFCETFSVTRPDTLITDGPAGYFDGTYDIIEYAADHDICSPKPPLTYSVALTFVGEFTVGPPKFLITESLDPNGGIVVYWNGNWDAVEWWRKSQTMDTVNMFKNMVFYFVDHVPGGAVQEMTWGGIKGVFSP
jgi:hypothetical protein